LSEVITINFWGTWLISSTATAVASTRSRKRRTA